MNRLPLALLLVAIAGPGPADAKPERPEPVIERKVAEDDNVRIEELRVRGEPQSIVVKNKKSGVLPAEYEIVPRTGARDPSVEGQSNGQRVWHLLSF